MGTYGYAKEVANKLENDGEYKLVNELFDDPMEIVDYLDGKPFKSGLTPDGKPDPRAEEFYKNNSDPEAFPDEVFEFFDEKDAAQRNELGLSEEDYYTYKHS